MALVSKIMICWHPCKCGWMKAREFATWTIPLAIKKKPKNKDLTQLEEDSQNDQNTMPMKEFESVALNDYLPGLAQINSNWWILYLTRSHLDWTLIC